MPTMRKQMPICGIRSNRSATARTAQHGVSLSDTIGCLILNGEGRVSDGFLVNCYFIVKGSLQDLSHSTLAFEIYETLKT
jgi:hypothetical protein